MGPLARRDTLVKEGSWMLAVSYKGHLSPPLLISEQPDLDQSHNLIHVLGYHTANRYVQTPLIYSN